MPTPPTLNFDLQNRTNSNTVFAYITGRALDNGNALFLLRADGQTPYFPTSPPTTISPLMEDCAIRLGAPGSTTTITIPHLAGARLYFSLDGQLTFKLNPGPALVEPSVTNPTDPNLNINFGFAEFTYNSNELYANISYVDFVSVPISLTLTSSSPAKPPAQHVSGIPSTGLATVCDRLRAQDSADNAGWSRLIVRAPGNPAATPLRALSPNTGIATNPSLFSGYYNAYVSAVWSRYSSQPLSINTQSGLWGTVIGQVNNNNNNNNNDHNHNLLTFSNGQAFGPPSAADIFSCSTGPFAEMGSPERGALIARLSAAFNRSTLLTDADGVIPDDPPAYYQEPVTNHYARILHEVNLDGRGYAFPYDDVVPSRGGRGDVSGAVVSGEPGVLTVAVGGEGAYVAGEGAEEEEGRGEL